MMLSRAISGSLSRAPASAQSVFPTSLVQARRLTIELAEYVTVFRYEDLPGMIGRVGTIFGAHGINISSGGSTPPDRYGSAHGRARGRRRQLPAAMVVTTDAAVPGRGRLGDRRLDGFVDGGRCILRLRRRGAIG